VECIWRIGALKIVRILHVSLSLVDLAPRCVINFLQKYLKYNISRFEHYALIKPEILARSDVSQQTYDARVSRQLGAELVD
jgi:hypothetical protein